MNLASSNHEAAHVKAHNPKGLSDDRQIRIDLDYYKNGQLLMVHIANALACDMTESRLARDTFQALREKATTGPEAREFIGRLSNALRDIEYWREKNGGIPYNGEACGVRNRHVSAPVDFGGHGV